MPWKPAQKPVATVKQRRSNPSSSSSSHSSSDMTGGGGASISTMSHSMLIGSGSFSCGRAAGLRAAAGAASTAPCPPAARPPASSPHATSIAHAGTVYRHPLKSKLFVFFLKKTIQKFEPCSRNKVPETQEKLRFCSWILKRIPKPPTNLHLVLETLRWSAVASRPGHCAPRRPGVLQPRATCRRCASCRRRSCRTYPRMPRPRSGQ